MSTVAQIIGHRAPILGAPHPKLAFNSNIGIELEIEEVSYLDVPGWTCTEDGSLRNGCELVCSEPYSGERLYSAIESLSNAVTRSDAQGTWRCSTHVHLDVRDCDTNTVKKIILGWAFYEKLLFKCSGFHRYRSNFCPAFAVVQAQVINASVAFNYEDSSFIDRLVRSWDKYTSLNLLPITQFGSVEFRVSEPKWKRTNLLNLVNRYLTIKKLAVENNHLSNQEFINHLQSLGFSPMIDYLPLDYNINEDDLIEGYELANDVLNLRANDVNVIPRIRLNPASPDVVAQHVIPVDIVPDWSSYVDHAMGQNARYRLVFQQIFDVRRRSEVQEMTMDQFRRLIDGWEATHQPDDSRAIRDIIIRRFNEFYESVVDSI